MSEQNKAIVQQVYSNFKTGNIEGLLNLLTDNISWELPEIESVPFAGKRTGRASVGEFFKIVATSQETLAFEPRELIADGEKVVSLGNYEWRVKANGRKFAADFAHVFTIRNGKVVAFKEFTDTAAASLAYRKAMTA